MMDLDLPDDDLLESISQIETAHTSSQSAVLEEVTTPPKHEQAKSPRRPATNDCSLRLPKEWSKNMSFQDQCWIGKAMFAGKGNLVRELKNWWYPPQTPSPNSTSVLQPDCYFLRRIFLWMPKKMWDLVLQCPKCNIAERTLQSKGTYPRVRLVLDIKDYYYLAAEYLHCKGCGGSFIAWDQRILASLSDAVRLTFPVVMTYRYACDNAVISLLRSRTLGNSPTALQNTIRELHSEEWMRRCVSYLSDCKRHQVSSRAFLQAPVEYKKEQQFKDPPTAKWFLACYVRDVYNRLDSLKAVTTAVYGRILKIDSTKKVTRKLQGKDANTASWVTNVGNERGEVLNSILTTSESIASLTVMVNGLIDRFAQADVPSPVLLYTDRECCSNQGGASKYQVLFSAWTNMLIRLDIFHFMRRCAVGCTSESHPLYGVFMASLSRCIFEWDDEDLTHLYAAKRAEMCASGMKRPSVEAVRKAVGKRELAKHCRRRTRGAEATEALLHSLFETMAGATDVLGVPLFRDEMLSAIWPEQQRHMPCIQDPPGISLYTKTGEVKKGGISLPVYRCGRGTTSLESFHLHLARFIPGTSAGAVAFQAYLVEGLARWNMQRSKDSVDRNADDKVRSFDVSLKSRLNTLSSAIRGQPSLPSFTSPAAYTGEVIGVEYLRSQSGDATTCTPQQLDNDIDEAFGDDFEMDSDGEDAGGDLETDETVALPEESSDSGAEDDNMAVDAAGIPGWDKVAKLADALLGLDGHVTNKQVDAIRQLYLNLDEYDRRPLTFAASPGKKVQKGRFLKKKQSTGSHVSVDAMARCFVSGGQPAKCPSKSRIVEAICVRLVEEAVEQRAKGPGNPYMSKWKVVLINYNRLRNTIVNSRLYTETQLQLFAINETTISKWHKNKTRVDEVTMLLQGLAELPAPPLAASEPLDQPLVRPSAPLHLQPLDVEPLDVEPLDVQPSAPTTTTLVTSKDQPRTILPKTCEPAVHVNTAEVPRTTAWRHRKKRALQDEKEAARSQGLPSPKKVRLTYSCKKCGNAQTKDTGHSQYYGQTYCPNESGQIPKEEWLKKKSEERKLKKAAAKAD